LKLKSSLGKIYKNLIITKDNDVWAYYKCPLTDMSMRNLQKQEDYKRKMEQFFNGLVKYKDIDIQINPHTMNLEKRFEEFSKEYDPDLYDLAKNTEERSIAMLEKELKTLTTETFYIGVRINSVSSARTLKGKVTETCEGAIATVLARSGYQLAIDKEFIERYAPTEEVLFQQMGMVNASRLSGKEMVHLYHYHYIRGTKESLNPTGELSSNYSITDTILDPNEHAGIIEMKSKSGTKYVSFLPIAKFKPNLRFNHIVQLSQELPFPVEFHLKGHFEPLKGGASIQTKKERANRKLKNVAKESYDSGDLESKKGKLNRFMLRDLEGKIDDKIPILKWIASFAVFGDTPEECQKRSAAVINLIDSVKVEVVNGTADQIKLFHKFLPADAISDMKDWLHYTTVEGVSEMMIGLDNRVGDNVGFPIGCVSNLANVNGKRVEEIAKACRKRVLYNPFLASEQVLGKVSDSPHIAITGPTGGGKSFLAKFLFVLSSYMKGKGLYVDPKSEFKKWILRVINNKKYQKKYPLFIEYLKSYHFVTLDPNEKENWGVLDPICFLTGTDAKDIAESIFEQIYDFSEKEDARVEMLRNVKRVIAQRENGEQVGLMNVIKRMQESGNSEVKKTGNALFEIVDGSSLQLAFSYGDSKSLNLTDKVTVLEISGLKLPKATDNPRNYSAVQKKNIALMLPLGKFCEQFGKRDYNEHTYVAFDEAWIFTVARGGSDVVNDMRKVGRSQNNQLIFITQSIRDVNTEDESGNFGRIFAFDKMDERKLILEHMGLEVNDSNIEWLATMPARHCLYKDLYGRVNRILVYCPFEELVEMFRTVEETTTGKAEEMFAA
jgi:hypothetical protein